MTRQSDLTERELIEEECLCRNIWIAQPKLNPNNEDMQWEVRKEEADRATKDFATREDAWEHAKKLARENATHPKPAGARLKKSSDGQFAENRFYPHPNQKDNDSAVEESEPEGEIVPVNINLEKPVKASEYYDSRMQSDGMGDAYMRASRLDKDLYIGGREKNGQIAHNRDIKAQQATSDDVTFIYPTKHDLSEEEMDSVAEILGIKGKFQSSHIFYYRSVRGRDKPYINALKTAPEKALKPSAVTAMLERNNIEYDEMRDSVMAYIPKSKL